MCHIPHKLIEMKKSLLMLMLLTILMSCNGSQQEKELNSIEEFNSPTPKAEGNVASNSRGYELMQQKCYICHIERPDPSMSGEMIAPPMSQVQEHYKPSYPNQEEFVKAMVSFIQNPSEEKTLMPGAVKKFNLMPKLIYNEPELRLIAETIYTHDFGPAFQMNMQNRNQILQLNKGQKWDIKQASIERINVISQRMQDFKSTDVSDYNQLGKEVFDEAKMILLDDSYTGELFDQLHNFFGSIETNMHALIAAKDIEAAEQELKILKNKFQEFHNYFE